MEGERSLSVSQYKTYEECPYAWKLARVDKVWQRPAAWLAQGSAEHTVFEAYERSGRSMTVEEMKALFLVEYAREIAKYTEDTPNMEWWFPSGPYRGPQDVERRYHIGLEQIPRYPAWYERHPEEVIWIAPDGTPGIELEFDIDLDGVRVRGFIDAVIDRRGYVVVRDDKTGKVPGDDFQLGTYGVALAETYDIEPPDTGDYWMGVSGKPTFPYDLSEWSRDRVAEKFHELADNIRAERFDPDPEPKKCMFCAVAYSCAFSQA
ncbi:RecB family exonuclease [Nocardia farcinica]|uniref:RecB family exonuclease n=1 Tax=Nocardia farcinica TaxID=37329 RepID=UPI000760D1F1|nr:PD-(D/E)XK nuclease family protein [Nocardia farcinica]AXK89576.1 PD-(D/E)XK nuclease family protein [Nocardia farcinica]